MVDLEIRVYTFKCVLATIKYTMRQNTAPEHDDVL